MSDPRATDRLRQAWLAMTEAAGPGQGCPEPDQIWEALEGGLPPEEVRRIVEHTASCPACAEAWRLARDMGAMEERALPRELQPAEPRTSRLGFWHLRPLALAAGLAGLVILAGGTVWLWPDRSGQEAQYRATDKKTIRALTSEEQPQPRAACHLRWTPGPAGTRYTIRISTEDFVQVSAAEGLEQAEFLVPPSALQGLPPRARLLWQIQAFLPEGGHELSETFFVVVE